MFRRKPEVTVEEFCREFYDSAIFHAVIGHVDLTMELWGGMFEQLVTVDPGIAAVQRDRFDSEMTALRLELFGLAFFHSVWSEAKNTRQAGVTRAYLEAEGRVDLIDAMAEFNTAVAESALDIAEGERRRRARAVFLNGYRVKVYEKLAKKAHADGVRETGPYRDIAVVLNRYDTAMAWQRNLTHRRLAAALAKRLVCSPSPDGWLCLQAFIEGMYNGAKGAIAQAKIT